MKLDAEGFEYDLLPHLITRGGLCGVVDVLVIEWHEKYQTRNGLNHSHSLYGRSGELTRQIESSRCGVPTVSWV